MSYLSSSSSSSSSSFEMNYFDYRPGMDEDSPDSYNHNAVELPRAASPSAVYRSVVSDKTYTLVDVVVPQKAEDTQSIQSSSPASSFTHRILEKVCSRSEQDESRSNRFKRQSKSQSKSQSTLENSSRKISNSTSLRDRLMILKAVAWWLVSIIGFFIHTTSL